MSITSISQQVATYTPAVIAGVQAAEVSGASGSAKLQAVLDGIQAGSAAAELIPIPQVEAIAALVNLVVSIFNSLGIFKHNSTSVVGAAAKSVVKAGK